MASSRLDKDYVRSRLQSGQYILLRKTNVKNANLWDSLKIVCDAKSRQYLDVVQCEKCKALFHMKDGGSTTSLSKHVNKCNSAFGQMGSRHETAPLPPPSAPFSMRTPAPQPVLSPVPSPTPSTPTASPLPPSPTPTLEVMSSSSFSGSERVSADPPVQSKSRPRKKVKEFTRQEKSKITDMCVKFAAIDLRPYNAVKGEGFKQLAQGLINVGTEHGKIDVSEVLPHPSTVSKKTSAVAKRVIADFLPEVKSALNEGACAFGTDMWSDKYSRKAYVTLDCQYSTPEFELKSLTLFTKQFPADRKKSGSNIRQLLETELANMQFDLNAVRKAFFNTDEGSNLKKGLKQYNRLNCTAHVIATVLRTIFDFHKVKEKSYLYRNARDCYDCIMACQRIVVYLKRSGKNVQLAKTVKLMAETRWNTLHDMLESVVAMLVDIIPILRENGEERKLDGWDAEIALQLIQFLEHFKSVTIELQAKKFPTLHLVLVRYYNLIEHCTGADTDHNEIAILKGKAAGLLQSKLQLHDVHFAAAFLCPNTRTLLCATPEHKRRAREVVIRMLQEIAREEPEVERSATQPSAPKRGRFNRWEDGDGESSEAAAEVEYDFYLKVGKADSDDPARILPWWKEKLSMFKLLAKLARRILTVPATSASSERTFSRAGLIVTDKRTSLSPDKINDLLVIHNYYLAQEGKKDAAHEARMFADDVESSEGEEVHQPPDDDIFNEDIENDNNKDDDEEIENESQGSVSDSDGKSD